MLNWHISPFCNQGSLVSTIVDRFSWRMLPVDHIMVNHFPPFMKACVANRPPTRDFYAGYYGSLYDQYAS